MTEHAEELATVSNWNILWIVGVAALLGFITLQFAPAVLAEAVVFATMGTLFAVALWWPLRAQLRAWVVVGAVAASHVVLLLVLVLPSDHQPARGDSVFLMLDMMIVLILSALIETRTRPIKPSDS